jgi:hypothetical protein
MTTLVARLNIGLIVIGSVSTVARAQTALTWSDIRARFRPNNPSLQAGLIGFATPSRFRISVAAPHSWIFCSRNSSTGRCKSAT